jgi:hypothetical protein
MLLIISDLPCLLSAVHAGENAKSWQRIEMDEYDYEQADNRNAEYYQRLTLEQLSKSEGEVEGHMVPGRIFDSPGTAFSFLFTGHFCC